MTRNIDSNNTRFVERRGAIVSAAVASQLTRNSQIAR